MSDGPPFEAAFPRLGGSECRAYIAALPYYNQLLPDGSRLVPKTADENAVWRLGLIERAEENPEFAAVVRRMCSEDLLFFANAICWTLDPNRERMTNPVTGRPLPNEFPMVTWDYQDDDMVEVELAISRGYDLWTIKSREMAGSWNRLIVMYWRWLFRRRNSFLLLSAVEEKVDARNDTDTQFGKLDILWDHTPEFLRPQGFTPILHRRHMHFFNPATRSAFDGASTSSRTGHGGRRTAIFPDEASLMENFQAVLAGIARNSHCLLPLGTPKPLAVEFARKIEDPNQHVLRLGWYYRPDYRAGLYTSEEGIVRRLDPGYVYPDDFVFIPDGHLRSPWHDADERRWGNPALHAQETDMNIAGSAPRLFDQPTVDRLVALYCREPLLSLPLRSIFDPGEDPVWKAFWARVGHPMVHLLIPLQGKGGDLRAPRDRKYAVGFDVSTGTGASNSVIHVADSKECRQVFEFSCPNVLPEELAHIGVCVGRMFQGMDEKWPMANWEEKGVGKAFSIKLRELGWLHLFWHMPEGNRKKKPPTAPGWNPTDQNQTTLLLALRDGINGGGYKILSTEAIRECGHYQYDGSTLRHSGELTSDDPSGARSNHGDRCFAAGLAYFPIRSYIRVIDEVDEADDGWRPDPPPGSAAHRRQAYEEVQRATSDPLGDW